MLRQLQPAAAASLSPLLLFLSPVLVTAHRIDCHCHCPCCCPSCNHVASSLAYYYVNSFHLFPFRAAFFFSSFFSLPFSLETCAQTFKSIVPQTTLPEGACRSQCNCYAKCEHAPKSSSKCAQIDTAHPPLHYPLFSLLSTANNFGQHARQSSQKRNGSRQFDYRANQASPNLCKRLPKDNSKLYLLGCKCELKEHK